MSLAAAVASNALANRLPLRFCSAPICRDRQKPLPFRNSAFLGAHGSHGNHVVLLQKGLPRPGLLGWQSRGFASGAEASVRGDAPDQVSLDAFLSIAEVVCVAPSIVFAVGGVIGSLLPGGAPKLFQVNSGNVLFVWQFFLLVGAVVIGGVTRQRQWQRISKYNGATGCDLIQRIEKVEEDLRSSATIVRVLSRQLEKLGIRFRVTRKALKEPIAETATLAQKNSEATRALALQEDILEKELGEIQKVLLAMQEQQQKQLDLILAIAKASRLFEGQRSPSGQDATSLVSEKKKLERTDVQMGKNDKF